MASLPLIPRTSTNHLANHHSPLPTSPSLPSIIPPGLTRRSSDHGGESEDSKRHFHIRSPSPGYIETIPLHRRSGSDSSDDLEDDHNVDEMGVDEEDWVDERQLVSEHPQGITRNWLGLPRPINKPRRNKNRLAESIHSPQPFSTITFILETLPPLFLSVLGGILTGELLEKVQHFPAFVRVPELFILLPVLMNLKGNLEMNLAARLSTSANVGLLDTATTRRSLFLGNLTLLQVQALIVSFLASMLSFILGLLSRNNLPSIKHIPPKPGKLQGAGWNSSLQGSYFECLLVLSAGMLAASVNCVLLGTLMCAIVLVCRFFKLNPDNITTPVASCLGDLLTLIFLTITASLFICFVNTFVSTIVFAALVFSIGLHGSMTFRNSFVQEYLLVGWWPLLGAMLISTCTGLVLESVVNKFDGYAMIAPVLTGICGNIGTISISRISTSLHSKSPEPSLKVGSILVVLSMSILAGFASWSARAAHLEIDIMFMVGFMICVFLCSVISILLAHHLSHQLWNQGYDPDIYAIPILSSLMDLIGQSLLVITFSLFKLNS